MIAGTTIAVPLVRRLQLQFVSCRPGAGRPPAAVESTGARWPIKHPVGHAEPRVSPAHGLPRQPLGSRMMAIHSALRHRTCTSVMHSR
jgi:hypothetical protein